MRRSFERFLARLEEHGLRDKIEQRALEQFVSLRALYEGPIKVPSIVAARRSIYRWLMKNGKGLNEVARLFDRLPSGVRKLVDGGKRK
jgi:hypothetical protein